MVNDPIGDFINRLKTAGAVKKETVSLPYSKMKAEVSNLLKKEGYLAHTTEKGAGIKKTLEIGLLYKKDGSPRITDVKRVSKLSRRAYLGFKDMIPVKFGSGITVLSTPNGVMSDKEAKKQHVGGEVLFKIW